MIANGEGAQVLWTHGQFANTTHWNGHGASDGHGREIFQGGFTRVGDDLDPLVVGGDHGFNVGQWHVFFQLEGECLEFERNLEAEGFIFQDAYLENYLQSILNGLHSKEFIVGKRQGELNVKVLKDNSLNAFILPNGTMYINVGLLAVLQNEDELKAVMLHELAHFILDHYIVNLGKLKKEEARLAFWSSVATATAAAARPRSSCARPSSRPPP